MPPATASLKLAAIAAILLACAAAAIFAPLANGQRPPPASAAITEMDASAPFGSAPLLLAELRCRELKATSNFYVISSISGYSFSAYI